MKGTGFMDLHEEIFEKAILLARAELSEGEKSALGEMCAAACHELSYRLREGISVDDIRGQFVRAAATLGLSLFLGAGADKTSRVSAGSLSVSKRSGDSSARSLRRQAELMLAGYLKDSGFAFRAVRV